MKPLRLAVKGLSSLPPDLLFPAAKTTLTKNPERSLDDIWESDEVNASVAAAPFGLISSNLFPNTSE